MGSVGDWNRLIVKKIIDAEFQACFDDYSLTAVVVVDDIVDQELIVRGGGCSDKMKEF